MSTEPAPVAGAPRSRRFLRWATVVLPAVFVVAVAFAGHWVLFPALHSVYASLLVLAVGGAGTFLFSRWVFSRVETAELRVVYRQQELLLLNTVAAAASRPMQLEQLLQVAVDGAVDAMGADAGLVCILDERERELQHVAYKDLPEELLGPLKRAKLEEDPIGSQVVDSGEPVQIRDLLADPRIGERGRQSGFRSMISLPLKSEGKVKGVMVLMDRTPGTIEASRVQFLLTLGGQLAVAIERTQLHRQVADQAVVEERERIAREMHDGLAQVLGYINVKTSAISRLLSDGNIEDAQMEVVGLRDAARGVYGDVRESILGLRLASAPPGSPVENLREYTDSFSELSGISITLEGLDNEVLALDAAVETQAMRVLQEALTNVRKHAEATRVRLHAERSDGLLQLTVEDNGRGFAVEDATSDGRRHFGLQTMLERARGVGGNLTVKSKPGAGTRVVLTVPAGSGDG